MKNRLVVVTGGANGIGKAVSQAFAKEGHRVITIDKEKQTWEQERVVPLQADLADYEQVQATMNHISEEFGTPTVLINNVGVSTFKDFFELTIDEWNHVLQTNVTSTFLLSQGFAKKMKKEENPAAIINISSTRAYMSEPDSEAYATSKGGIVALTHAMAVSLQDTTISVNAIAPGWIHTGDVEELREVDHRQHPSKRVGTPNDIAQACLFLADPKNNFINGETLTIDGGMTRKMIYEH
ncbi:SDR family NAD(P)-dependent oxidoreductase [Shouchella sp. JSM 1781072]|uniref:SDR family NAD(P)-dependent oxidoreductase n=1 Tax=Bacillaceae TaxID=186817 RepID=UPI000C073234|nr:MULTISPECIES: SDR family oxidoreductase [Bacillaceae]UTR05358.1 SDR family oxidoreductase [Alkalihalobacillus sp. LMS6]